MPDANVEFKIVRDPLHGFIELTEIENRVLQTAIVQRLSRIKQLSHSYLVFPGAVHTRLEHSLGCLHVATRMCERLRFDDETTKRVRLAAFLHDVGQGPFSHLFEKPMSWINGENFSHERVSRLIIEKDPTITEVMGDETDEVLSLLGGNSVMSDVISGSLDADKLDYLRRDSLHTGVAYGLFDLERIVRTICKVTEGDREYLAVMEKGRDSLESYRLARYSMHAQVYEHHARLIADDMFTRAMKIALKEGVLKKEILDMSESDFLSNYALLDDGSIHHLLMSQPGLQCDLIRKLRNRDLLKRAFVVPLSKDGVRDPIKRDQLIRLSTEELEKIEEQISAKIGCDRNLVIVHLQKIQIKLYEEFEQTIGKKEKPILIRNDDGSLDEYESPISASPNPIRRLFVFVPADLAISAKPVCEAEFGVKSLYDPQTKLRPP